MNRREMMAAGAGLVPVVGLTAIAAGQDRFTPPVHTPQGDANRAAGGAGNANNAMLDNEDPTMAACLLIKGHKQIQVCTWALDKIQDPDVKAFAQAEIDEHENLKKKLQDAGYQFPTAPASRADLGGGTGNNATTTGNATGGVSTATGGNSSGGNTSSDPGTLRSANSDRNTATTTNNATTTNAAGRRGGRSLAVGRTMLPQPAADMVALDVEVGEQCIATTKAEQQKFSGKDFDKRFIGSQLDAHYGLFDHGVVFRKHASRELAPILDNARTIIEQHIATCKKLMDKLDAAKA